MDEYLHCGCISSSSGVTLSRTLIKYADLPEMTSADVIIGATMQMYMAGVNQAEQTTNQVIEVHKVTEVWESESVTWVHSDKYDPAVEDQVVAAEVGLYAWNVTDIVREWYQGENTGMMFKLPNAVESQQNLNIYFSSSDNRAYSASVRPSLTIFFRNNNGLESYWDYISSSAGRAGTGYVNQYTGNMVWVRENIGFGGNRMPVSISHIYNANDGAEEIFGLGRGWRTNFHQRVFQWDQDSDYYVWEDSDGTDHYFLHESGSTYKDEDGLELTLTTSGSGTKKYCISDKYGNCSYFDTNGRLTQLSNNQATKSTIDITYTTDLGLLISTVTDGAGREYSFTYSNGLLNRISYKGTGTTELSYVTFGYTGSRLTSVTDKDGKTTTYNYNAKKLLSSATDIDGYKLGFAYTTDTEGQPSRIKTIAEYSGTTPGGALHLEYGQNQTRITDHDGNTQILQFNNMGNTVSIQDDQGRAQYAGYDLNDPREESGKGNQLNLSSKLQNTVSNLLENSSFETGSSTWTPIDNAGTQSVVTTASYHGNKSLKFVTDTAGTARGVYEGSFTVAAGESIAFSAYVKAESGNAYLTLGPGAPLLEKSETLGEGSDWTRLEVGYTHISSANQSVTARLYTTGTAYMDCAQVERMPTPSRYNLVENGDFRFAANWSSTQGRTTATPAAPQLSTNVYRIVGSATAENRISQTVQVSGKKDDCFVLGGWAMGDSVPLTEENRKFALIATFMNGSEEVNTEVVSFNPWVESWQYAAEPIIAKGAYTSIVIKLAYDYNANTAYFDGIQLFKEAFGTSYDYYTDGSVKSVTDIQGQKTTYEYTGNDLTKQILPNNAELTYTYDNYHNVKTATDAANVVYHFDYDTYGNNTSVYISSGDLLLKSSATYTSDGNRLATTTDAAYKTTTYSYNANTNVLEWVQYPEDTEATRTVYTYDNMYRLARTQAAVDTGYTLRASYGYTNDLLSSITTQSTTYNFTYGDFGLRTQVNIGSQNIAKYTYTSRNNYLQKLAYGNNDSVQYTYDDLGRVTKQTYEDSDTVRYVYDNNGELASVIDSASGITSRYFYDLSGRMMRYTENATDYSHSVTYNYDKLNNLSVLMEEINGATRRTAYTYDDNNRVTKIGHGTARESYTYDAYGRVATRTNTSGEDTILTDTLTYRELSGIRTSGQVYKLTTTTAANAYNASYTYTYDSNGNILSVKDKNNKTTSYVYDSANQLVRENNQAQNKTWVYAYDNAGNIENRKEYAYTTGTLGTVVDTIDYVYGDTNWGDLLTKYDGQNISYDEIGNPTSYYNGTRWSMTWEHGRELATISNGSTTWTNTYNADGLRTKRTNGTKTYNYVYLGDKLIQMHVGDDVLKFGYDANGSPMYLQFNNSRYFYATNAQGDVMALVHTSGTAVVEYTYDAWGNILTTTGSMAGTLGQINPLRYRGYVYDAETGLYYLQSRYYDPAVGRFVNADILVSTGQGILGNNMFAYCNNNPVMYCDPTGRFFVDWDVLPNWEAGKTFAEWLLEQTKSDKEAIESGEVTYKSNGAGNGAHIENSHKIKTLWVMYDFIEENRGDEVDGSTAGVVYEWLFHNIAYEIGEFLNMDSISVPAANLDFGKTIFDDVRKPLTAQWFMSQFMKCSYGIILPGFAIRDAYAGFGGR